MVERKLDLIVIGADYAGLAAAACAAEAGAHVALVRTGAEPPIGLASPPVPNFVWRRLRLHESGYQAEKPSARISLFPDGQRFRMNENEWDCFEALGDKGSNAATIWPEFASASGRLADDGVGRARPLSSPDDAALGPTTLSSANETLDDYFQDEQLKTHLATAVLLQLGLAGDEPGSAAALAQYAVGGWPRRARENGPSLFEALTAACSRFGVEFVDGKVLQVLNGPGGALDPVLSKGVRGGRRGKAKLRMPTVTFEAGDELRASFVMSGSAAMAHAAGLVAMAGFSPLVRPGGARAFVRIVLNEKVSEEMAEENGAYFIVDSRDELAAARDDMLEGRTPETPPIAFELEGDTVFACAPYCPARIAGEEGFRDWTGQDRQALGRAVLERICQRLGVNPNAKSVDVQIEDAFSRQGMDRLVAAPSPSPDELRSAAVMALEAIRSGEKTS